MSDGNGIGYPFAAPPDAGAATEVAPGILWLRLPLPMALDHVNVYALNDGDGWTVVDTGLDTRRTRALWGDILTGPLKGRPIRRVIATHHHPDHAGLAGWFRAEGAELLATRTAWLMTRMLQLDEQDRPAAETVAFWRAAGMDPAVLDRRLGERPFNFADVTAPLPLGYTRLAEGGQIAAGGRTWDIRTGDGHAPEHATLWSRDDAVVIGGDQFLPSISPNLGSYATEPMADPVGDWLASCARFQTEARDDQLVLPGHKLPFRGLPFRLGQLIDNHHGALDRLEAHLSMPRAAGDCFQPLFRRRIDDGEYGLALVEAMAHCIHLWKTGRASREVTPEGRWLWHAAG